MLSRTDHKSIENDKPNERHPISIPNQWKQNLQEFDFELFGTYCILQIWPPATFSRSQISRKCSLAKNVAIRKRYSRNWYQLKAKEKSFYKKLENRRCIVGDIVGASPTIQLCWIIKSKRNSMEFIQNALMQVSWYFILIIDFFSDI